MNVLAYLEFIVVFLPTDKRLKKKYIIEPNARKKKKEMKKTNEQTKLN